MPYRGDLVVEMAPDKSMRVVLQDHAASFVLSIGVGDPRLPNHDNGRENVVETVVLQGSGCRM
jgi:hypothetical protein